MDIEIRTHAGVGCLEVVYLTPTVTSQALAQQRQALAAALAQSNIGKVLVDTRSLAKFPSTLICLDHNKAIAEDEQLRKAKFAVVCASLGAEERSLETIAVNRFLQVQCFTSRDEALAWLSDSDE
jgi:hypothetical protein